MAACSVSIKEKRRKEVSFNFKKPKKQKNLFYTRYLALLVLYLPYARRMLIFTN
jgi:hypothetical protein